MKEKKAKKIKKIRIKKDNVVSKFFDDFKKFITKGNVVDLAVAVVVGGAFGKIVSSLVADIIMPLITGLLGSISVKDLKWIIVEATETTSEVAVMYGNFLQTIIDFLIISFFIFVALKLLMSAKNMTTTLVKKIVEDEDGNQVEQVEVAPPVPTEAEKTNILLGEIKELLVKQTKDQQKEDKTDE